MTASLSLATLLLSAAAVANTSYEPAEGSFVLRHEAVVPAPPTAVWEAFSTAEGWTEWAVPFARISLRLGGHLELRAIFEQGNAWTLERLVERFTRGPVDWSVQTRPGPEAGSDGAEILD